MNTIQKFLYAGIIAIVLGGLALMLHPNTGQAQEAGSLSVTEAKEYIDAHKGDSTFTILDVRTPEEYAEGHIPGAVLLNFKAAGFAAKLEELPKGNTYLVYCRSGMRSAKAAALMREKGFPAVLNMQGGILEWQKAELPIAKD